MLIRDSLTRGGVTTSLGIGVNPDASNSSTSGGNSVEQMLTSWMKSSETTLTTNSRVSSTLRSVSFQPPSLPLIIGEKQTTGGLALPAVKKLNSASLRMPSGLRGDTKAIGRATIAPIVSRYTAECGVELC